jgi:nucleoid-associated protein YgaU
MSDATRKYGGMTALGLVALVAISGLIYLGLNPQQHATPPAPPPAPTASVTPPTFDVVRVDAQGNAVLAGRAAPGAVVTVKSGTEVIGSATADSLGAFVVLPANPLKPGAQEITLSEKLPNGTVIAGTGSASIDVPAGAGKALAVLSGPNGSTVVSGQGPQPGTMGIGTVDYDAKGKAIFSGTAPAGARVKLSLGGHVLGQAVAGSDGRWKLTAGVPAASGTLTLSANNAGTELGPVSAPFELETLPGALAAGHVVIAPGENLWVFARQAYGRGTLYTVIYNANAGQIHNPNLIFPGQAFALPKTEAAP